MTYRFKKLFEKFANPVLAGVGVMLTIALVVPGLHFPDFVRWILLALTLLLWSAMILLWKTLAGRSVNRILEDLFVSVDQASADLSSAIVGFSSGDMTGKVKSKPRGFSQREASRNGELGLLASSLATSMNSNIEEFNAITSQPSRRLCFVGDNSYQEGRAMGLIIGEQLGGRGSVAVFAVAFDQVIHALRAKGCVGALKERYPNVRIVAYGEGRGDVGNVADEIEKVLEHQRDLHAIYLTDGASPTVVHQRLQNRHENPVRLYAHDLNEDNAALLRDGHLETVLAENFYAQTFNSAMYLYNALCCSWKPLSRKIYGEPSVIRRDTLGRYWDFQQGQRILTEEEKATLVEPMDSPHEREFKIALILPVKGSFFEMGGRGADAAKEILEQRGCRVEVIEAFDDWEHFASEEAIGPRIRDVVHGGFDGFTTAVFDRRVENRINEAVEAGLVVTTFNSEPLNFREFLGNVFQNFDGLRSHSSELAAAAEESSRANQQISQSMGSIADRSENQRRRLQETERNFEHLNEGLKGIGQSMDRYSDAVSAMSQEATVGGQAVDDSGEASRNLSVSIRRINDALGNLSDSLERISTIISTIDSFASDTNVLAINASIQAARAGESGRSFAIIAGQIRSISEQSTRATEEVYSIIQGIDASMKTVLNESKSNLAYMGESESKIIGAGKAFQSISGHLRESEDAFRDIHQTVKSIQGASNAVQEAMLQVDRLNTESVGSIQEITMAIQELSKQSRDLSQTAAALLDMAQNQGLLLRQFTL